VGGVFTSRNRYEDGFWDAVLAIGLAVTFISGAALAVIRLAS
jgi:hypothetical protein